MPERRKIWCYSLTLESFCVFFLFDSLAQFKNYGTDFPSFVLKCHLLRKLGTKRLQQHEKVFLSINGRGG